MAFKRINGLFDQTLNIIPGGLFGLFSVLIGIGGDIIAFLHFPGYSIFYNMISELGTGPGGIFFNIGVFISGLVAIPFDVHLGKILLKEEKSRLTYRAGLASSIVSCISLSMIGVFPADQSRPIIFLLHGTFAFISFLGGAIYLVIFGNSMMNDDRFSNKLAWYCFIVATLFLSVIFSWLPLVEWIANFGIISWSIITASYMLKKKIY